MRDTLNIMFFIHATVRKWHAIVFDSIPTRFYINLTILVIAYLIYTTGTMLNFAA